MVTTSATTTDTAGTENSYTDCTDNTQRCVHRVASFTQAHEHSFVPRCIANKQECSVSLSDTDFTTADGVASCYVNVPHELSLSDGKDITCTIETRKNDTITDESMSKSAAKRHSIVSDIRTCKTRSCRTTRSKLSSSSTTAGITTGPSNGVCCNEMKVICGKTVMVQQENSLVISDFCLNHGKTDNCGKSLNGLNDRISESNDASCDGTIRTDMCENVHDLSSLKDTVFGDSEKQFSSNQSIENVNKPRCLHVNKFSENSKNLYNDGKLCSTKMCCASGMGEKFAFRSCINTTNCVMGANEVMCSASNSNRATEFSTMERECGLKLNEQVNTFTPLSCASENMSVVKDIQSIEEKCVCNAPSVRCSLPLFRIKDVLNKLGLSNSENNTCTKKEQGLNKENSECTIDTSVTSVREMKSVWVKSTKPDNMCANEENLSETSFNFNTNSDTSSNSNFENELSVSNTSSFLNISSNSSCSDTSSTQNSNVQVKNTRRVFCLYCDRTFVNSNLRQKHIDRTHSITQSRRSSSRTPSHNQSSPACMYCGKLYYTAEDLKKLFEHLTIEHSSKYHGCLLCTERFTSKDVLSVHNKKVHNIVENVNEISTEPETKPDKSSIKSDTQATSDSTIVAPTSKNLKPTASEISNIDILKDNENPIVNDCVNFDNFTAANVITDEPAKTPQTNKSEEISKILNEKSTKKLKCIPKTRAAHNISKTHPRTCRRTTRSSVVNAQTNQKSKYKQSKLNTESVNDTIKLEITKEIVTKIDIEQQSVAKENVSTPVTYEFDENFFSCVSFNIRDNLMNHLDGKLFHITDSVAYDSSLIKSSADTNLKQNQDSLNFGDNLALAAITPITTLLTSQSGIDSYQQIEYGSKAPIVKRHFVKYNFRSRKQKNTEYDIPKDVSKLDMWTQIAMKLRQQKVKNLSVGKNNERHTISDDTCRKAELQVEELNRILDMRGPFQDLREEALNSSQKLLEEKKFAGNDENSDEIKIVIEDILINVFEKSTKTIENTYTSTTSVNLDKFINDRLKINITDEHKKTVHVTTESKSDMTSSELDACYQIVTRSRLHNENSSSKSIESDENRTRNIEINFPKDDEIPNYFKLSRNIIPVASTSTEDTKIKTINESLISLGIDVKQIEHFLSDIDLNVIVTSSVELSGEWARPRIYICGACGVKVPNLKQLEDHKFFAHPYIWCMHYEFVGNQSDFYRHLNIPGLGRMLEVEKLKISGDFVWNRSTSRVCSKCNKQCNSLGDLHRHMLECGGDWTWMLAKKKCKYRPYGSRRRRQRGMKRNLTGRLTTNGDVDDERKRRVYRTDRSKLAGPRPPRPSDADTIQRMLANLPPKRATRKILSFKEGVTRQRKVNHNINSTKSTAKSKLILSKTKLDSNKQKSKYKFKSARLRKLNSKTESTLSSSIKAASKKLKQTLQKNLRDRNLLQKSQNQSKSVVEKVNNLKEDIIKSTLPKIKSRSINKSYSGNIADPEESQNNLNQTKILPKNRNNIINKVLSSKVIETTTAQGPKSKILRSMNKISKNAFLKPVSQKEEQTPINNSVKFKKKKIPKKIELKNNTMINLECDLHSTISINNSNINKIEDNVKTNRKTSSKNKFVKKAKILRHTRSSKLTAALFKKKLRSNQTEMTPNQNEIISFQKESMFSQKEARMEQKSEIEKDMNLKALNNMTQKKKQGVNTNGKIIKRARSLRALSNIRKNKLNSLRKSVRSSKGNNILGDEKKITNEKKISAKITDNVIRLGPFKKAISVDGLVNFDCASNDSLNSVKIAHEEDNEDTKNTDENIKNTQLVHVKLKKSFKSFKNNISNFANRFHKKENDIISNQINEATTEIDNSDHTLIKSDVNSKKRNNKRMNRMRNLRARLSKRIKDKSKTNNEEIVSSEKNTSEELIQTLTKSVLNSDLNKKNISKRKKQTRVNVKKFIRKEKANEINVSTNLQTENVSFANTIEMLHSEKEDKNKKFESTNETLIIPTLKKIDPITDDNINKTPISEDVPVLLLPVVSSGSQKRKPTEIKKIPNITEIYSEEDSVDIIPVRENIYPICNLSNKKHNKDHSRETENGSLKIENLKKMDVVDYVPDFENEVLDLSVRKNKDNGNDIVPKPTYSSNYNPLHSTSLSDNEINIVSVKTDDKFKSKSIKKTARKLNDCIAMLTCKLQQKLDEHSCIFNNSSINNSQNNDGLEIADEFVLNENNISYSTGKNTSIISKEMNNFSSVIENQIINDKMSIKQFTNDIKSADTISYEKKLNIDKTQVVVDNVGFKSVTEKNDVMNEDSEIMSTEKIVIENKICLEDKTAEGNKCVDEKRNHVKLVSGTTLIKTIEEEKILDSIADVHALDDINLNERLNAVVPLMKEEIRQVLYTSSNEKVLDLNKQVAINEDLKMNQVKLRNKSHHKIGNTQRQKKIKRKKQQDDEIAHKEQEEIINLLLDSKVNEIFMGKDEAELNSEFATISNHNLYVNEAATLIHKKSINEVDNFDNIPLSNIDKIINSVAKNINLNSDNIENEICDISQNSFESSLSDEKLEHIGILMENMSDDFESLDKMYLSDSSSEDIPLIKLIDTEKKKKRVKKNTIKIKVKKFSLKAKRKSMKKRSQKLIKNGRRRKSVNQSSSLTNMKLIKKEFKISKNNVTNNLLDTGKYESVREKSDLISKELSFQENTNILLPEENNSVPLDVICNPFVDTEIPTFKNISSEELIHTSIVQEDATKPLDNIITSTIENNTNICAHEESTTISSSTKNTNICSREELTIISSPVEDVSITTSLEDSNTPIQSKGIQVPIYLENIDESISSQTINKSISLEHIDTSISVEGINTSMSLDDINTAIPIENINSSSILNNLNISAPLEDTNISIPLENIHLFPPLEHIKNTSPKETNTIVHQKDFSATVSTEDHNISIFPENNKVAIDKKYFNHEEGIIANLQTSIIGSSSQEYFKHTASKDDNILTSLVDTTLISSNNNNNTHITDQENYVLPERGEMLTITANLNSRKDYIKSNTSEKNMSIFSTQDEALLPRNNFMYQEQLYDNLNETSSELTVQSRKCTKNSPIIQKNDTHENDDNLESFNSDILNQKNSKSNKILDEKSSEFNMDHTTKNDYQQFEIVDSGKENNNLHVSETLAKNKRKKIKNKRKLKTVDKTQHSTETLNSEPVTNNDKIDLNIYSTNIEKDDTICNLNEEIGNLEDRNNGNKINNQTMSAPSVSVLNSVINNAVSVHENICTDYKNSKSPLSSTDSEDEIPLSKFISFQTNLELSEVQNCDKDVHIDINLPKLIDDLSPILDENELTILDNCLNKNNLISEEEMPIMNTDEVCLLLKQNEIVENHIDKEILKKSSESTSVATTDKNEVDKIELPSKENEIDKIQLPSKENEIIENLIDKESISECVLDNINKSKEEINYRTVKNVNIDFKDSRTEAENENNCEIIHNCNPVKKIHKKKKGSKVSKVKKHISKVNYSSDIKTMLTNNIDKVEPIILHLSRKTGDSSTNNESDFVITEIRGTKDIPFSESKESTNINTIVENINMTEMNNESSNITNLNVYNNESNSDIKELLNDSLKIISQENENFNIETETLNAVRHSPVLLKIKTNKMRKLTRKAKKPRKTANKIKEIVQSKKEDVDHFCEICTKHFCRADNLAKHKMTFTHIAKLSELEAKQEEIRRKNQKQTNSNLLEQSNNIFKENNVNLEKNNLKTHSDIEDSDNIKEELCKTNSVHKSFPNGSSIELFENINHIIDKKTQSDFNHITLDSDDDSYVDSCQLETDINYPDLVTSNQPKRYRSLGERKSFDLNPILSTNPFRTIDPEPMSNIPENNKNNISKSVFADTCEASDTLNLVTKKHTSSSHLIKLNDKNKEPFIFIDDKSDTSNHKSNKIIGPFTNRFEDNYSGKKLNRDEELFLECCSLLKSSSESHKPNKKNLANITESKFKIISRDSFGNKETNLGVENLNNSKLDNWSSSESITSDWISNRDSASNTPFGAVLINNTSYKWLEQEKQTRNKPNSLIDSRYEDISSNSNSILINRDNLDIQYEDISISSVETNPCQHYESENIDQEQFSEIEEQELNIQFTDNVNSVSNEDAHKTNHLDNLEVHFKNSTDENIKHVIMDKKNVMNDLLNTLEENKTKNNSKVKESSNAESLPQDTRESITENTDSNPLRIGETHSEEINGDEDKETLDSVAEANTKILTKGAKKVFEGIKVSIPTHELNLSEVLNCSVSAKTLNGAKNNNFAEDQNSSNAPSNLNNTSSSLKLYKNGVEVSQSVLKSSRIKQIIKTAELTICNDTIVNGSKKKNCGFFNRIGNKLGFREIKRGKSTKTKVLRNKQVKNKTGAKKTEMPKVKDVYDFEDTQDDDGLGLFSSQNKLPLFKSYRSQKNNLITDITENNSHNTNNLTELNVHSNVEDSDSEPYPYIDSLSVDNSPSSEEDVPATKVKTIQKRKLKSKKINVKNDNQKKCMIMGRIFKHVVKNKSSETADVNELDNIKSVEENVKKIEKTDATENIKLSEQEIDSIFDALLGRESSAIEHEITSLKKICNESSEVNDLEKKNNISCYTGIEIDSFKNIQKHSEIVPSAQVTQKSKKCTKKSRTRTDSSSDDEFCLSTKKSIKTNRKRTIKKQKVQQTLNLEQEIRECIGVAGRKSQRKCTSGKQNVLVEFWSSDELSDTEVNNRKQKNSESTTAVIDSIEKEDQNDDCKILELKIPIDQNDSEQVKENVENIVQDDNALSGENKNCEMSTSLLEENINTVKNVNASQKLKHKTNVSLQPPRRKVFQRKRPLKRVKKSEKSHKVQRRPNGAKQKQVCITVINEQPLTNVESHNKELPLTSESIESLAMTRRKRSASEKLYYWSSSSDDEFEDMIEVKPIREDPEDDRPIQHGWIVGDSPKKLVTLLAHAKGKKIDAECVKEQGKRNKISA